MSDQASRTPWMQVRVEGGSETDRERALVAACECGATGAEELEGPPAALMLFATASDMPAVRRAVREACPSLHVETASPLPDVEWSEAWKEGLEPLLVGDRLVIRPSFWEGALPGARAELVLDPGQAFGTGGHASTRLALEWLCDLLPAHLAGEEVLDVGCGTGVLALAALRLGAARALALDLDPLATAATVANARANGLGDRVEVFLGPLEETPTTAYGVVVANMIRTELFPVLPAMRDRLAAGGTLILSGLLRAEEPETRTLLEELGLEWEGSKEVRDPLGDHWMSVHARRAEV